MERPLKAAVLIFFNSSNTSFPLVIAPFESCDPFQP
jgi:hypothetical protein